MRISTQLAFTQANNIKGVVGDGNGNVYFCDGGGVLRHIDLDTGGVRLITSGLATNPTGICLVSPASALIGRNTTSVHLIELGSGFTQNYSGMDTAATTDRDQVHAGNPDTKIMLGASLSVNGRVIKFDANTFQGSNLAIGSIAALSSCVIVKPGSANFLVGWANGTITEIDANGTVVKTITLNVSKNIGTAPTLSVNSLALVNDTLLASTDNGVVFVYRYSSSTLLQRFLVSCSIAGRQRGGAQFTVLGNGIVGWMNNTTTNNVNALTVADTLPSGRIGQNMIYNYGLGAPVFFLGCDTGRRILWIAHNNRLVLLKFTSDSMTDVEALIQDPPGTAVDGRVIRLRDYEGLGSTVVTDQSIAAEATNIPARKGETYLEIILRGSGAERKWDWRRFNV